MKFKLISLFFATALLTACGGDQAESAGSSASAGGLESTTQESELINGVSFQNWAAASAHSTRGMSDKDIAKTLGVQLSAWEDASEKWNLKLATLMKEDINIATVYGDIFNNPNVGKFANSKTDVSIEGVLKKVPTYDKHQEIFYHIAAYPNDDYDDMLKREYGLKNEAEWVQVSAHWFEHDKQRSGVYIEGKATAEQVQQTQEWSEHSYEVREKWKKVFAEKYN